MCMFRICGTYTFDRSSRYWNKDGKKRPSLSRLFYYTCTRFLHPVARIYNNAYIVIIIIIFRSRNLSRVKRASPRAYIFNARYNKSHFIIIIIIKTYTNIIILICKRVEYSTRTVIRLTRRGGGLVRGPGSVRAQRRRAADLPKRR